jgi:hypothetical protein
MVDRIVIWYHEKILKHQVIRQKVTVGMMDVSLGVLVTCSCDKMWAL